jgi:predicted TIM-barrel fold metal-dependent hydrolase
MYPGSFHRREDLVGAMARYGIGNALVYHSLAREYNPQLGNGEVLKETGQEPALFPAWVVLPHHTGEFPEPKKLVAMMKAANVRAARMFPAEWEQQFSLAEWNCGALFSTLEEHRVPLFIGLDQVDWRSIQELLSRHPALDVVLTDVSYRIDRNVYALLDRHARLSIETIGYKVHRGIEEICRRFGAERLVFGSGMPVYSGAAAVTMIRYARISDTEKQMIAHGNLERMLGGVT